MFFICNPAWVRTTSTWFSMSNFQPQGGRGKPVKQLSDESFPKQVFLCPSGRGGGLTLGSISALAYQFSSFFSCNIKLHLSKFIFPVCRNSCFSLFHQRACVFN